MSSWSTPPPAGSASILVQWAKALGAVVIGTAGSEAKLEIARRLGADHVLLTEQPDLADRVREITDGQGVPVVYDFGRQDHLRRLPRLRWPGAA